MATMFDSYALKGDVFSWDAAVSLCNFSFFTYESNPKSLFILSQGQVLEVFDFKDTDSRALAYFDGTNIFIAFRGTQAGLAIENLLQPTDPALMDFKIDADFHQVVFPGFPSAAVHQGFFDSMDGLWQGLDTFIKTKAPKAVIFCGHSLGGAIAILAAARAQRLHMPVDSVYTFGSPRAGNSSFADAYNTLLGNRTYRLVTLKDLVPRLPFKEPGLLEHLNTAIAGHTFLSFLSRLKITQELDYSHAGKTLFVDAVPLLTDWASHVSSPPLGEVSEFIREKAKAHLSYPTVIPDAKSKYGTLPLNFLLMKSPC